MKHSDIRVTSAGDKRNSLNTSFRKLFFLAGYLALVFVATGVASTQKEVESAPFIIGLDPLKKWPSPLQMHCEEKTSPTLKAITQNSVRICKPRAHTSNEVSTKSTEPQSRFN